MLRLVLLLFGSFRAARHSRADLVIENLALRQQLAVLAHTGRRGRVTGADRLFRVTLRRLWTRWSDVLVFVKPETVIQCQRPGPHNGECPRPAPSEDGLQKPLAERYRRALGRKRSSRIARSLRRLQRASPSPTAGRVRCLLPSGPHALRA